MFLKDRHFDIYIDYGDIIILNNKSEIESIK